MSEKPKQKITLESIKIGDIVLDLHGDEHEITQELYNRLHKYNQKEGKSPIYRNKITGTFIHKNWRKEVKREKKEKKELETEKFILMLKSLNAKLDFKISGRGWCYILEGEGIIDKSQFKQTEVKINNCRKIGLLPIDFTIEDETRQFYNVEPLQIDYINPKEFIYEQLVPVKKLYQNKDDISFWNFQDCYIQVITEKADIVNLFYDICEECHIPIANAKGRSDINQRNLLVQRFKKAEELGKTPILLYYADHDPAGIKIVDDMMNNLRQIEKATGWNPKNLIIDRFGLTKEFIDAYDLTWIDNLITGGKRDLGKLYEKYEAGTLGKKETLYQYEIDYIEKYGPKKCEVNAVLKISDIAREHLRDTINIYLGNECFDEYNIELEKNRKEVKDMLRSVKFRNRISRILRDVFELEE